MLKIFLEERYSSVSLYIMTIKIVTLYQLILITSTSVHIELYITALMKHNTAHAIDSPVILIFKSIIHLLCNTPDTTDPRLSDEIDNLTTCRLFMTSSIESE